MINQFLNADIVFNGEVGLVNRSSLQRSPLVKSIELRITQLVEYFNTKYFVVEGGKLGMNWFAYESLDLSIMTLVGPESNKTFKLCLALVVQIQMLNKTQYGYKNCFKTFIKTICDQKILI